MNSVPLSQINIGLLANQVGVTATNTLDLGERVHDLLLSLDVCVQQTQDVLEVRLLARDERHDRQLCSLTSCLADLSIVVWN